MSIKSSHVYGTTYGFPSSSAKTIPTTGRYISLHWHLQNETFRARKGDLVVVHGIPSGQWVTPPPELRFCSAGGTLGGGTFDITLEVLENTCITTGRLFRDPFEFYKAELQAFYAYRQSIIDRAS